MISSPCRYCEKKDRPKDNCAGDCKALEEVQLFQISRRGVDRSAGMDITEELRVAAHAGQMRFDRLSD